MQKVEGSGPFIRASERAGNGGFLFASLRRRSPGTPDGNGRWIDSVGYAILRDEWEARDSC
jgi:RimJ/RimL family protein N-acetyltransferase